MSDEAVQVQIRPRIFKVNYVQHEPHEVVADRYTYQPDAVIPGMAKYTFFRGDRTVAWVHSECVASVDTLGWSDDDES